MRLEDSKAFRRKAEHLRPGPKGSNTRFELLLSSKPTCFTKRTKTTTNLAEHHCSLPRQLSGTTKNFPVLLRTPSKTSICGVTCDREIRL